MATAKIHRIGEGDQLLREQLARALECSKALLAALKGFRRDLALSLQACPKFLRAEFGGNPTLLAIPELEGGQSFSDLHKALDLAEETVEGGIALKNPPRGPETIARKNVLQETGVIHANLMKIAEAGHRLYECIQNAGFEFDVFNTKNIEGGVTEANILFDRDALNISMTLARAIAERAVRLDISLTEARQRLVSGIPQI